MPPDRPGALAESEYLGVIAYVLQSNGGKPSAQPLTAATTGAPRRRPRSAGRARRRGGVGRRKPRRGRGAGWLPAKPAEPTGVTVHGTVKNFVPVTDAMLRNPSDKRLAHAAPRLQRDELQPARASHGATT